MRVNAGIRQTLEQLSYMHTVVDPGTLLFQSSKLIVKVELGPESQYVRKIGFLRK